VSVNLVTVVVWFELKVGSIANLIHQLCSSDCKPNTTASLQIFGWSKV
jgi:hypothetical protein